MGLPTPIPGVPRQPHRSRGVSTRIVRDRLDLDWSYTPEGLGLSYLTAPLDENVVLAGPGYADLWIQTNADDAPIEIVLSEVTPDGNEIRIQTGVQLAGFRKIDEERSGQFLSRLLFGEDDYEPLSSDLTLVRVPIFDVAHPLRAGSRLRVQINTPGRDLPLWFFDNPEPGTVGNMKSLFAPAALYSSSRILPLAVSDSPSRPWRSRWAASPLGFDPRVVRVPLGSISHILLMTTPPQVGRIAAQAHVA